MGTQSIKSGRLTQRMHLVRRKSPQIDQGRYVIHEVSDSRYPECSMSTLRVCYTENIAHTNIQTYNLASGHSVFYAVFLHWMCLKEARRSAKFATAKCMVCQLAPENL